jgi:serine/threonine protein kinase
MQKGGGVIIKPSEAHKSKQDIFNFLLTNSKIKIFSYKTRGGVILKLELESEIASPYMSVNPESLGQDVKIIFFKLVFIGNSKFDIYDNNGNEIIYLNQASKLDFENEVKVQNDIYEKTQGINLSPLCPAVLDSYHLDKKITCQLLLENCKTKLTTQDEKNLFDLIIQHFKSSNFTIGLQVMEYIENSKTLASYIYDEEYKKINTELTKDLYTLAFFKLKTLHSLGYRHNDLHSSNVLVKKIDNCVCSIGKSCCCFDGYDVLIIDFGKTTKPTKKQDFVNSINSETTGFDLINQLKGNFSTYESGSKEIEKCIKNKVKEFILNTPNVKKIYEDMGLKEQYKKIIIDTIREMYPGSEYEKIEQWVNNNININNKSLNELLLEIDKSFIEFLSRTLSFDESTVEKVLKFTEDKEKGVKFNYAISKKILQLYKHLNQTEYNEDKTKKLFELLQIPDITIEQAKEILQFQVKEILQLHNEINVSIETIIELYKIPISFEEKKIIAELHKDTDVPIETIVDIMKIPNATIDITRQLLQLHKETNVPHETIVDIMKIPNATIDITIQLLQLHKDTNVPLETILNIMKIPNATIDITIQLLQLHKDTNVPLETILDIMKIPNATIDITRQLLQLHKETRVPVEIIVKEIVFVLNYFNSISLNISALNAIELVKLVEHLKTNNIQVNYKQAFVIITLFAITKINPVFIYNYLIHYNPNDHFETAKKYYTGEDQIQLMVIATNLSAVNGMGRGRKSRRKTHGKSRRKSHGKSHGKSRRKSRRKSHGKSHGKSRAKTHGKSHGKSRANTHGKSHGKSRGKSRGKTRGK